MKNFRKLLFLVFAVLAFLVSCGGSEGSGSGGAGYGGGNGSGGIYGHVTDFATGEDVANANVQLRPGGDTTLTGSDGMFEFRDLTSGDYSITVSKAGYSDLVDDYVITVKDRMVRRDIQLKEIAEIPPCDASNNTPCRDTQTNYIWSSRSRADMNWYDAMAYCDSLTEGQYTDWGLPSQDVLITLYDRENYDPDNGANKLGDWGCFWSSTVGNEEEDAYMIEFAHDEGGYTYDYRPKSHYCSVRCVRW